MRCTEQDFYFLQDEYHAEMKDSYSLLYRPSAPTFGLLLRSFATTSGSAGLHDFSALPLAEPLRTLCKS